MLVNALIIWFVLGLLAASHARTFDGMMVGAAVVFAVPVLFAGWLVFG